MDTELLMKHMTGNTTANNTQQPQDNSEPFSLADLRHCRPEQEDIIMENR
jgi:hypothetical protein